jgi:hypothetical protein
MFKYKLNKFIQPLTIPCLVIAFTHSTQRTLPALADSLRQQMHIPSLLPSRSVSLKILFDEHLFPEPLVYRRSFTIATLDTADH